MGNIIDYKKPKETFSEHRMKVLAITPATLSMIRYAGPEGKVELALVMEFGTEDDGHPSMVVLASDNAKLAETAQPASTWIRNGVNKLRTPVSDAPPPEVGG